MLLLQGAQVQSLVGELGSHTLCGMEKKKKSNWAGGCCLGQHRRGTFPSAEKALLDNADLANTFPDQVISKSSVDPKFRCRCFHGTCDSLIIYNRTNFTNSKNVLFLLPIFYHA